MIRALIIEDDIYGIEALCDLIKDYCPGVEIVGTARSAETGRQAINTLKPDLVFQDIELPGENGFDLLESLPEIDFEIIFVTAYDKYALKAFRFHAIDYLMKPIDVEELQEAVLIVEKRKSKENSKENMDLLLKNLRQGNNYLQNIALPSSEGFVFVKVNDIIHLKAQLNYTTLYMATGEQLTICRTLKEFEHLLADSNFARVHQSHMVNLHQLAKYVKGKGGHVEMKDGTKIQVSSSKKEAFLRKLSKV